MSKSLDLNLLPVAQFAGSDQTELLGLYAAEPPKRAARGRGSDRLVLYLAVIGNAPIPPVKQERLLADLANLYFTTTGSVTSGMRAVAQATNESLLERNLKIANSGRQGIGLLTQFVLRDDQVYLGVSGSVQAFLISSDGVQHFYSPEMEGKGLGQSRTPLISYHQTKLKVGDTLLIGAQPGSNWNQATLSGLHGQGPQSLRRKLFPPNMDVHAVLIQARQGKGNIYMPSPQPTSRRQVPSDTVDDELAVAPSPPIAVPPKPQASPSFVVDEGLEQIEAEVIGSPEKQTVQTEMSSEEVPVSFQPIDTGAQAAQGRRGPDLTSVWKSLALVGLPLLKALQSIGRGFAVLFERLIPPEISSTVMAFVAVAVPVIVVTVGSVVYNQLGRSAQYDDLYLQAQQLAEQTMAITDVQARRASWDQVLALLQQVEEYRVTPETQAIREVAIQDLDALDLAKRVDYQPAIADQLPPVVNVTHMVVSDEDLYLLDGNSGNVIRAVPADLGYVVDNTFKCGPGPIGGAEAGMLIDLVAWPAGFIPNASVLALDDRGNVIYCSPDEPPKIDLLAPSSSQSWGQPTAMTLDMSDLYVLDPSVNAVWIYWGSEVQEEPTLFFDQEIPNLQDVIDLTANNGELYLLHSDGHVTLCYLGTSGVSPTRCSPTAYVDNRPGLEGQPMIIPNPFTQISFTPPPDPSLYLLGPEHHAVYHYSLRNLVYKSQYLPKDSLSVDPATTFYVNSVKRTIYLAIGHKVYYGVMP